MHLHTQKATPEVLFFVNSDCPIARRYSPEISRIAKEFGSTFKFRLLYCDPKTSDLELRKHHTDFGFVMRWDRDPVHSLAKQLKVSVVPAVVVIDAKKHILYTGRIDDSYGTDFKWRKPKHLDLRNALESIRFGKKIVVKKTNPIGCTLVTP
jgi:AhpC/TSA family